MPSRVRVFIATSVDGFIAGPNDELDWLGGYEGVEDTFTPFMTEIGAMLMGRRTYDAVRNMDASWAYGETPVLIATTRELMPERVTVRPIQGPLAQMLDEAKQAAGDKDVYIDGGTLIRSALEEDLIDEVTLTVIPIILGKGIPLFAGTAQRHPLDLIGQRPLGGGLIELKYRPKRPQTA